MNTQDYYQKSIQFAAMKHAEVNQFVPGTKLPYLMHLSNVAMEILIADKETASWNMHFAIQLALLHDTLEDTRTAFEELNQEFGIKVATGVMALTKNLDLPKEQQMPDSLQRIKKLDKEVWCVKLADRITNLQPPPFYWKSYKIKQYQEEANIILEELKGANEYLEKRLAHKIEAYGNYIK